MAAAAAAAAGAVQVVGDSYFSCPSSPAWSTATRTALKPPPGFEAAAAAAAAAIPSTASGGWSSTRYVHGVEIGSDWGCMKPSHAFAARSEPFRRKQHHRSRVEGLAESDYLCSRTIVVH